MEKLLIENGFKADGLSFCRGLHRVFFDDITIHVIQFSNPQRTIIEWRSTIDHNMGDEKAMKVIEAMTA